jgi:hypothetical protein
MDADINRIYKICHSGMLLSRNEGGAGQSLRPSEFLEKQLLFSRFPVSFMPPLQGV